MSRQAAIVTLLAALLVTLLVGAMHIGYVAGHEHALKEVAAWRPKPAFEVKCDTSAPTWGVNCQMVKP